MEQIPYLIIGGGVIGSAITHKLSQEYGSDVYLIERNAKIKGENQSSRNSGVSHAGLYYPNSSEPNKAKHCVRGNRLLEEFCTENNVPYNRVGKLVVATNLQEQEYLLPLLEIALANGVPGVKIISSEEIKKIEPNVEGIAALYAPTSGVIEPLSYITKLHQLAKKRGANFIFGYEVKEIIPTKDGFMVRTQSGDYKEEFEAKVLINAAGLYSDEIARLVNPDFPYHIAPMRGEAVKFYTQSRENLSTQMNIYPTPHGVWPNGEKLEASYEEYQKLFAEKKVARTVGVHLTPAFDLVDRKYILGKTTTMGPATVGKVGKEDYQQTRPESYYLQRVQGFFPGLKLEDLLLHQCGILARLKEKNDFVMEYDKKYPSLINLVGIDSPGITASLSIALEVGEMVRNVR